ncbi:MAG TPA: hypothetical protein VGM73_16160 [Candidatus Didemnitutus sp.]|jgi:hypothetical protein
MIRILPVLLALGFTQLAHASDAAPGRELVISGPTRAQAGTDVGFSIHAITRVGGGERIGFFHGEYSTDGGAHWTGFVYDQNDGPEAARDLTVRAGEAHSRILIRVRVAFRDGAAGDVDYTGAAIRWSATWNAWDEPPARKFAVDVE